jgi:hypothetical protein
MNQAEVHDVLATELEKYRTWKFEDLLRLINDRLDYPITAPSGVIYNMDVQADWDTEPNENLRVMAAIDDGGPSAITPMCASFIVAPDGRFVGA